MLFASALPATTATVNYTDLWWNSPAESESGWGVNMTQQGTKLFMTRWRSRNRVSCSFSP